MSTKIYANARFGFREDTLENWTKNNPVLERGEPAVVRDGQNGEWLKIGDGVTRWKELPYKLGPKGDKGETGSQGLKGNKGDTGADGNDGISPVVRINPTTNEWEVSIDGGINFTSTNVKATGEKGADGKDGKDVTVDQIYDPASENAQSGVAIGGELGNVWGAVSSIGGLVDQANGNVSMALDNVENLQGQVDIASSNAGEAIGRVGILEPIVADNTQRIGVVESRTAPKNYELIATIKVAPDENGNLPTSIVFTQDSNGNPFELTDFYLSMVCGATDGSAARIALYVNDKMVFGNAAISLNTSLRQWYTNYMNLSNGILCVAPNLSIGHTYHATTGNANITSLSGNVLLPTFKGYNPVTKVRFTIMVGTTKTFIEGSEFKLYGVRK